MVVVYLLNQRGFSGSSWPKAAGPRLPRGEVVASVYPPGMGHQPISHFQRAVPEGCLYQAGPTGFDSAQELFRDLDI